MAVTFHCGHCHKQVSAPDSAGGKRGKCPYCKQSTYISAPVSDEDIPALAPIDEKEEQHRQAVIDELRAQERDLIAEMGGSEPVPLENRDDLTPEDLHHFVINYCLDMAGGRLDRAATYVDELKTFGHLGPAAVADFQDGKVTEPGLDGIPAPVVQRFLEQLAGELR
jgi:hypothetical protein